MSISPQRRDQIIDALRRGTVPQNSLDAFAVGIAQVALMAPSILFLPLGGLVADRGNARRLLLRYHFLYAVPPLVLALVLTVGQISYPLLIAYGLAAGSIGAFAVPTRDALLPTVAQGNLPRAVALAMRWGPCSSSAAQMAAMRPFQAMPMIQRTGGSPSSNNFRIGSPC